MIRASHKQGDEMAPVQASTLWQALLAARFLRGGTWAAMGASGAVTVSYDALIASAQTLAGQLVAQGVTPTDPDNRDDAMQPVGLMLPTGIAMMTAFFAVQALGRVGAMINFNAGVAGVLGACQTAQIRVILTSRAFVETVGLGLVVAALTTGGVQLLYVEDLADQAPFAAPVQQGADDPAVVLFTSGSEGLPKGVVLSHRNILSNIWQFHERLTLEASDVMFACLPLYHSFGLTVGALLPLISGMHVFLYSTPLHYHEIPQMIRASGATMILSTGTFLSGYARCGTEEDFKTLRLVVAGAEKLKPEVRTLWATRFGKEIYEGYGMTEAAPVVSVNTPSHRRTGSVGRLLPGIEARLTPIEGLDAGQMLWVRGDNIMLGYLRADKPGVLQPLPDAWYETGDVVQMDAEGYLSILGRMKRFAKIGGEMISLTRVELALSALWPENGHVVLSLPHPRKGEMLVLLTDRPHTDAHAILTYFRSQGIPDLAVPRRIVSVAHLPLLTSGKIDYVAAKQWAEGDAGAPLQALSA